MEKGRLMSGSIFEFNASLSECKDAQGGLSVPMSPADELFCNGRIRPLKPSAVPQKTPLPNFEHRSTAQSSVISKKGNDMEDKYGGRQRLRRNESDSRYRCTARSLSPRRNSSSQWEGKGEGKTKSKNGEGVLGFKVAGAASPSTLPKPRGSRRTWSLRDIFFNRSKSESGVQERDERGLFFSSDAKLSSSDGDKKRAPAQGKYVQKKKMADTSPKRTVCISSPSRKRVSGSAQELHYISSPNRREFRVSAHELHYTANRAQAEELRRKTFLPYRPGVLGCLGFPSPPAIRQGHVVHPVIRAPIQCRVNSV